MKKKCKLLNLSIRNTFILTFIITLLISVAAICVLLLVNWSSSAKDMTRNLSTHMVTEVYNNIETIVYQPKHINEINHKIISDGILDVNNETERERFFVSILRSHDEVVYSVAYATKDGEYYGARRNASGEIEIMRNDVSTGGHSWYYAVNADGTAGERAVDAGAFDPRIRPWYQAVAEAQAPAFSPIYKHFVMDDLTVSAGWPVYKNGVLDGVFVTHSLLTGIGTQIKSLVEVNDGFAIIFEKNGGAMVANSLELENFSVEEGVLQRKTIQDYKDLNDAYQFYIAENDNQFFDFYQQKRVNYSVEEYQNDGVEWIVLCGVPEDKLMMSVYHNIYITLAIVVTSLLAAFFVFSLLSKRFMKPLDQLAKTAEKFSSGNFSDRVQVARNDELGKIAKVFNQMAESTQYHISNLEVTVEKRTKDLKDSRERLRLLLDSAAEGIYGIDNKNICTFCNKSCLRLLGYHKSEELIGKEMHSKIHHKKANGSNYQEKDCIILKAIQKGQGVHVDDEVFWRADGTYFYVEYHAYPQIVDGKIVGGVVTFSDITERKKREEKINYLSFHDTLTGLLNRGGYEKEVKVADTAENLPLTVLFADVNGLKMTNDIFGHVNGDALIKETSRILKMFCRPQDILARVGGDEFVILMKKTNIETGQKMVQKIKTAFTKARIAAIKCSIALGIDSKTDTEQSLEEKMHNAEKAMYKDKTLNRKAVNKDIIDTIIDALHNKRNNERQHSETVSELCRQMGEALGLPAPEIIKLKQAGYLHDIGKVVLDDSLMTNNDLNEEEKEKMRQHSMVGYRILNLFDDTLDIADGVYSHHERWDGKGYPKGLKGSEIPLISRVIAVTETYERVLEREKGRGASAKEFALQEIVAGAGTRFDPDMVKIFIKLMKNQYS